jgi:hypothetical protein
MSEKASLFQTVYLVHGAVWSLWFVEPHTRNRPTRPDEPTPRHEPRNGSGHILFLLATYAGVIMLARASVDRSFGWA